MSAPLVLLHGFLGAPQAWDEVREHLVAAGASFEVIALHLPGHGPSPAASPLDWEGTVDAIARQLPTRAVVLAGYSMGARLALGLAARHRDRIAALALVSGHLGLVDPLIRAARRSEDEAMAALAERQGLAALVTVHAARPVLAAQASLSPATRERLERRRMAHVAGPIAASLRAAGLGAMPNLRGALAALARPVVALAGASDPSYAALAREAAAIAGGRVSVVAGGHDLLTEAPRAVAGALLELAGSVDR